MSSSNANNILNHSMTTNDRMVLRAASQMENYLRLEGCIDAANRISREIDAVTALAEGSQERRDLTAALRERVLSFRYLCRPRGRAGPASLLRRFLFPMPPPSWRRRANGARLTRDTA